jgi:hypothetical protein
MSLLYYISLPGVGPWNDALFNTGAQLRPYGSYLRTAIQAIKYAKPVLGWREPARPEVHGRLVPQEPRIVRPWLSGSTRVNRRTSQAVVRYRCSVADVMISRG